jgi:hypothetical protein
METGIVTALATVALHRSRGALLAAGLAAAWRPELLPWATILAAGRAWECGRWPRDVLVNLLLAAAPALAVAVVRWLVFGMAAPLAVLAKPSDLRHGLIYALAALIWTGLPVLAVAPRALARGDRWPRVVVAAGAVHFVVLALVGGDWMAFFRLAVPVLPGFVLAGAAAAEHAPRWASMARFLVASLIGLVLLLSRGGEARQVAEHRALLIRDAAVLLEDAERVAAADIGWVGAATRAHVVDLAGITDPTIAALPGGHTTKRVGSGLLHSRDVDHLVLLLAAGAEVERPWGESRFFKRVESRVAREAATSGFVVDGTVPLGGTRQQYLVVARSPVE